MALVEGVVGELLDDLEQLGAEALLVAVGGHARHELLLLGCHGGADLLAHGLAQRVGLGQGVTREALCHPHHALLVDHQPVGVGQDVGSVVVEVLDPAPAVLAVGVVVVHVGRHRPGPVERHQRADVVEGGGRQGADQRAHLGVLKLEDPDGVALLQHLEGGVVVQRDGVDVDDDPPGALDQFDGVGYHVEVAQAQEVHLQQAEILHAVHLVLGDDGCFRRVTALLRLALYGHVLGQRLGRDDHGGGVDAVLAPHALEPPSHVYHLGHVGFGVVHLAQLGRGHIAVSVALRFLEAVPQRGVSAQDQRRHGLGDLVAQRVGVAQHAGCVAHRGPGLDPPEGDDLGHMVAPVALGRVVDHLVPMARVEVHVDVGHRHPRRVEEPLEQQVVADRVEVGDAQAVGHRTARGRAAARPHPDAPAPGVGDQVPGDEEVGGEPHAVDDLELVGQPLGHVGGKGVAPALVRAGVCEVLQVGAVVVEAVGDVEVREAGRAELDVHVGALRDQQRVVAGLGELGEQAAHLRRGLQVVLVAVELEAVGVLQQRPGLHAQQRVVGRGVGAVRVVAVVGGQQRSVELAGDLQQLGVDPVLLRYAVVLQLDEEAVAAEDVLEAGRLGEGLGGVVPQQGLGHLAPEAAGGGDQARAVVVERLPVAAGLVVVALHEGPAGQLDEVLVAGVVGGQHRQVVVELAAALDVAAGVVDASPPRRPLVPGLLGHVGLDADDGLDVVVLALAVEVQDPVHVAVVGDAQRGLAVGGRGRDELVEPGGAVQYRVLRVGVEVDEGVRHRASCGQAG